MLVLTPDLRCVMRVSGEHRFKHLPATATATPGAQIGSVTLTDTRGAFEQRRVVQPTLAAIRVNK